MKKPLPYFKVVAVEGERSADLLLYGYIGQDFWWDDDLKEFRWNEGLARGARQLIND